CLPAQTLALKRARHSLDRVDLEDVARLDPRHAVDADATLEPGQHLANVVLEPLQRADRALADDLVAAPHSHLRVANDLAFRHGRAAHRAELGDDEDLAHLRPAERRLTDLRSEERRVGKEGRSRWSREH